MVFIEQKVEINILDPTKRSFAAGIRNSRQAESIISLTPFSKSFQIMKSRKIAEAQEHLEKAEKWQERSEFLIV